MGRGAGTRRWVVKIGSALITNDGRGLEPDVIGRWVAQMVSLRARGIDVVLVSSGSVAEGMSRLGLPHRPEALYELQAVAAIGQMGLVQAYEWCFQRHATHTAQVLLTHEDFSDRGRYLNARSTLRQLLSYGVVPVINENDAIATPETRLGDNDSLAGLVANLVEAELLVILTDQAGLFDRDPRTDASARFIESGRAGDPALEAMAGSGGTLDAAGCARNSEPQPSPPARVHQRASHQVANPVCWGAFWMASRSGRSSSRGKRRWVPASSGWPDN